MGRPSLAAQRTEEILDAFARCVARFGLEGSSLERIAEEAGVRRSILRHYVGNRADLVRALADRVLGTYEESLESYLGAECSVDGLLQFLFPGKPLSSAESVMVIESLIACGDQYPEIPARIGAYVNLLVDRVCGVLNTAYPEADSKNCWTVAWGLVSICFNEDSLSPLCLPPRYLKAARASAAILIASLE